MVKNPVMFMVEVGSILTLILSIFPTLFNGNLMKEFITS